MTKLNLTKYLPLEEGHYTNCQVKKMLPMEDLYESGKLSFIDITFMVEGHEIRDRIFANSDRFSRLAASLTRSYGDDFDTSLIADTMVNLDYSRKLSKGTEYNQTDNWEWLGGDEHVPF